MVTVAVTSATAAPPHVKGNTNFTMTAEWRPRARREGRREPPAPPLS